MSDKPPTVLRDWALAELDLRPGMSEDEMCRIIFQRLSDMDFMPPGAWDGALRVAGIAPSDGVANGPVFVPARRAVEEAVRAEIETFVAKFFSLPPDLRAAQYQQLIGQAAGMPALIARLEGLSPALDLPCELPTGQPPEAVELIDQVRRMFVSPRQERASRRLAFLQQCRRNWSRWQRVAIAVQWKIGRVASLEPVLFRELCASGNRERIRQKIARQRRRALRNGLLHKITRTSSDNRWWFAILAGVALTISRLPARINNQFTKPSARRSWSAQEAERRRELNRSLIDIQNELNQSEVERAAGRGELPRDFADRPVAPPEKTTSPPPNPSPPPLPTEGVEIRIAKSQDEAREMLRQFDEQRGRGQNGAPRMEMRTLNLEQARALLRQLREQQAQRGPNSSRDGAIKALEKVIDEAARSPRN